MAEENVDGKQELILNKYADESALDAGLGELAKQVGVPLGSYADLESKKAAYQSLSDIARIKREASKSAAPTALGEKKEAKEEPKDFFSLAGVSAEKFFSGEQLDDKELESIGNAWAKVASSPKDRNMLIDGVRQISLRAKEAEQKAETMAFRIAANRATGLDDEKIDDLLSRRVEVLGDDDESRAIETMLTKPQNKEVLVMGFKQLFEKAKGKGVFGEPAKQQQSQSIKGNVHGSSGGRELLTVEELRVLNAKAQAGDGAAMKRIINAQLKK